MSYAELAKNFPLQINSIGNAKRNGRLGHSFIVAGDSDQTRADFVLFLAMVASCEHSKDDGMPCRECRPCRMLSVGSYPDWLEISPVGKARQIRVGESRNPAQNSVRYFDEHLYMTGVEGRTIGVIQDADRLNENAQNALLKTLEEPPNGATIILSTAKPSALLPTTKSRCQIISLLTNQYEFSFKGATELFATLHKLWFSPERNLALGATASEVLMSVASNLEGGAKEQVAELYEAKIAQARDFDLALVKSIEERRDNEGFALYGRMREEFLEAINTFASQVFLLSCGAKSEMLSNYEMFANLSTPNVETMRPEVAEKFQQISSELIYNLRFNVGEELAIRSFALEIATLPAVQIS